MCLVVIAWQQHPAYPLILAGNRDEFHARPTLDADWWSDAPDIAGGRDLEAGGSWLAVNRDGRFATVTNYRGADSADRFQSSRGALVADFLRGDERPLDYLRRLDGDAFAGFNLLVGDTTELAYRSNRGHQPRRLPPGLYGLSNAELDSDWHKVRYAKAALAQVLRQDQISEDALFAMLAERSRAPLQNTNTDHLDQATAHAISAPFITLPDYGTRCSSALIREANGHSRLSEQRFDAGGKPQGRSSIRF